MSGEQRFQWSRLTMGCCYYPEQWQQTLWQSDLHRMLDAGISVIRIGEFAWSKVEPEEGAFTFAFFDSFLELCEQCGMRVIFGTPTATPPAWLTEKYPEVLNCRIDGAPYRHGSRRHYNYNAKIYRELCSRVVEALGARYAAHPAVIGWQIDNELNCETSEFYSEADTLAFRVYLKDKFRTLDALNEALGTTFWNQTYTAWEQLRLPQITVSGGVNPHMLLEYNRFIAESTLAFCRMQADILRRYVKTGDFITTNGLFFRVDNHRMAREALDVYTYDSYPNFAYAIDSDTAAALAPDRRWSAKLTQVRSVCPHFGIMEQQSGANGWVTRMEAPAPRPGQLSLWAMQSVAHGADMISFFRWRTCAYGTEIYWHGILDYDNRDNRKLAEVKRFSETLRSVDALCGADFVAGFAVLGDYDNDFDADIDTWHRRIAQASERGLYEASASSHTPYDVVYMGQDDSLARLTRYPLAVYPHPMLISEERVRVLRAYVEGGGTLILGCRSGLKDMYGKCPMLPQPGLLAELTHTDVRDFTFASPSEQPVSVLFEGEEMDAPVFHDILTPMEGARVLATYQGGYYKGEAALAEHRLGRGRVLHWGSTFSCANTRRLLAYAGVLEPFKAIAEASEAVELIVREKDGKRYLIALNYAASPRRLKLHRAARRLSDGKRLEGETELKAFDALVLAIEDKGGSVNAVNDSKGE